MIYPTLELAVAFNEALRQPDEWFQEPDESDRVERAISSVAEELDVVRAVGLLMARLVRAQGFTEGNKRTAFALGAWTLEQDGLSAKLILQASDMSILDLLLQATRGADVAEELVELLRVRASAL